MHVCKCGDGTCMRGTHACTCMRGTHACGDVIHMHDCV